MEGALTEAQNQKLQWQQILARFEKESQSPVGCGGYEHSKADLF
jgi:hypothetical protein